MIARTPMQADWRRRLLAVLVIVWLAISILMPVSPASAAAHDGAVRTFDAESAGAAPTGCSVTGAATVAAAALGGASATNRALKIVDQSATSLPAARCTFDASAGRAVTFRLWHDAGTAIVALMGPTGSSANGVWRFALANTAAGMEIRAYDGSSWQTVTTVREALTRDWMDVSISATLDEATVNVNGTSAVTRVRASSATALGDILFSASSTTGVGDTFFVDDLAVGTWTSRSFDAEAVGAVPAGCTASGAATIVGAPLAGAAANNRALQINDQDAAVLVSARCADASAPRKSAAFDLSHVLGKGIVAIMGAPGGSSNGVWRFLFAESGSDLVISAYSGTAWVQIGVLPDSARDGWHQVQINATLTRAEVVLDGVRLSTEVRASASTALGDVLFASSGTAAVGDRYSVDNLTLSSALPNSLAPAPTYRITTANAGTQIRFPDAVKLTSGDILVAYNEASSHTEVNGVIKVIRSSDNGVQWSSPQTVVDITHDPRDPKVVQLDDGTILMSYFEKQWISGGTASVFVVKSTDGGVTWSAPTLVSTAMQCGCGADGTGWAASHGAIVEADNGDLLMPLYGTVPGDARQRATVVRSTDGGATWDAATEVTLAVGTIHFQEPVLAVLPDGEIVALIRTTSSPVRAFLSRSFDNGKTWTAAATTDLPAESHHLLVTSDGQLLVTYGDKRFKWRPTSGVLIDDPSGSWDGRASTAALIYDSGAEDQANPSTVEVAPGEFLTFGYDVKKRTLSGTFTSTADYR